MNLKWNPSKLLLLQLHDGIDNKKSFLMFRNSSSAFIKNKNVRNYIYKKYNNCCNNCKSLINLEIDHIISVKNSFNNKDYYNCNSVENLMLLCKNCHNKKTDKI